MKTKLEMAHEFMMKKMETETIDNHWELFYTSWRYADAMQAEADKRKPSGFPNVLRGACGEIVAVKVDDNNFIEREGQHFNDVANQKRAPKVSRFERSDAVKEVLNRAENMGLIKPKADKEWQPDWSQAPDDATYWAMRQDVKCLWWKGKPLFDGSCFYDAVGICHTVGYAPSFGYTGDWRNSLRKRPQ